MSAATETEILIIGGGIAGASTAYHLARGGADVVLLERGEIAAEASGVNAGSIGGMGWGALPDLQAYLTMGSQEIFRDLQLELGCDIEYRRSGALQAIQNEAQLAFAHDHVLRLRARGFQVEILTGREARSLEPELCPSLPGCLHWPLSSQADPRKATRAFAAAAERHGARILTGHPVTALHPPTRGLYRIETPRGDFAAERLVLAAGAWCARLGEMLGIRIPIVPVRGQMWATGSLPPRLFHTLLAAESTLRWHSDAGHDAATPPELTHRGTERLTRHLYGRQTRDGEIIFGGDRQLVDFDTTPDPTGIAVNRDHAAEILPFLRDLPIQRTWAGLMPFSMDGAPLIGRIPPFDHLYIVSGLASSGFGRGPMAGRLLAGYLLTGHPHPVLVEADPARCVTPRE
jgi:glycine/D-amino acid oxidase-like deaminating enzyme